jgi:hypothetical protein
MPRPPKRLRQLRLPSGIIATMNGALTNSLM